MGTDPRTHQQGHAGCRPGRRGVGAVPRPRPLRRVLRHDRSRRCPRRCGGSSSSPAAHLLADSRHHAFMPNDACPDNNRCIGDAVVLFDFEFSGRMHVASTAAYCLVPFCSCWCLARLPDGMSDRMFAAFSDEYRPESPGRIPHQCRSRRCAADARLGATVRTLARPRGQSAPRRVACRPPTSSGRSNDSSGSRPNPLCSRTPHALPPRLPTCTAPST